MLQSGGKKRNKNVLQARVNGKQSKINIFSDTTFNDTMFNVPKIENLIKTWEIIIALKLTYILRASITCCLTFFPVAEFESLAAPL